MRRRRTTPILVIAILHLVGGGLGLIFSLCGAGSLAMSNAISSAMPTLPQRPGEVAPPRVPNAFDITKQLNERVPGYQVYTFGSLGIQFLLDVMLLVGGVGLLNMQPWARWLSLVYAPISILFRLANSVYTLVWIMPAMQALYAQYPVFEGMSGFLGVSTWIGLVVNLLIVIYPITVLVILLLPSTAAAFRGELPVREDDFDDDADDVDDSWREPPTRSDQFRR